MIFKFQDYRSSPNRNLTLSVDFPCVRYIAYDSEILILYISNYHFEIKRNEKNESECDKLIQAFESQYDDNYNETNITDLMGGVFDVIAARKVPFEELDLDHTGI